MSMQRFFRGERVILYQPPWYVRLWRRVFRRQRHIATITEVDQETGTITLDRSLNDL